MNPDTFETRQQTRTEAIVKAVNDKTGLKLIYKSCVGSLRIVAKDPKGKDHVIVADGPINGKLTIRSVLKRRGRCEMNWLCNGQASKGSIELHFWGDEEFRISDPAPLYPEQVKPQ
jgi:hypothetical protein